MQRPTLIQATTRRRAARLLLAAALAGATWHGWRALSPAAGAESGRTPTPCGRLTAPVLAECSGIVESRRYHGVFWVHNDSGDRARFFAVDSTGALLAVVAVDGARNVDWEDIAVDDSGHIYVADTGNNLDDRRDLTIYVVDEPDPRGATSVLHVPVRHRLPFRFPDQHAYPDSAHLNFDCEALAWSAGRLYLLTKHRSDTATTLYRLAPGVAGEQVAERLGSFRTGSPVTGADCSPDGKLLAVLSYRFIYLFERPASEDDFFSGRHWKLPLAAEQCEGICFAGDHLLVTNEQRDVYCVPLAAVRAAGGVPATRSGPSHGARDGAAVRQQAR